jgi:hypothetical protein
MAQLKETRVLSVKGTMRHDKRVIHFKLTPEQERAIDGYDVVALCLPEEFHHPYRIWWVPLKGFDLPRNFWGSRDRSDGLFAVWVDNTSAVKKDATLTDMAKYEPPSGLIESTLDF